MEYNTSLFDGETAERMLGHLSLLLDQVAADADVRLSRLELLTDEERGWVLAQWNGIQRPYPLDRCIHELIEEQAARTPAAVALVHGAERLTYAQVNGSANRLARELRD